LQPRRDTKAQLNRRSQVCETLAGTGVRVAKVSPSALNLASGHYFDRAGSLPAGQIHLGNGWASGYRAPYSGLEGVCTRPSACFSQHPCPEGKPRLDGGFDINNGMTYQREIQVQTTGHKEMHDLTGVVHIFNVGSTAAIGTIEFEPGLQEDLPQVLDKLFPPSRDYGHEHAWHDGNGHSHLQATMLGPSLTVPIRDRKLLLGTWQQIFHLECDIKPRRRTIAITVMGES